MTTYAKKLFRPDGTEVSSLEELTPNLAKEIRLFIYKDMILKVRCYHPMRAGVSCRLFIYMILTVPITHVFLSVA